MIDCDLDSVTGANKDLAFAVFTLGIKKFYDGKSSTFIPEPREGRQAAQQTGAEACKKGGGGGEAGRFTSRGAHNS